MSICESLLLPLPGPFVTCQDHPVRHLSVLKLHSAPSAASLLALLDLADGCCCKINVPA